MSEQETPTPVAPDLVETLGTYSSGLSPQQQRAALQAAQHTEMLTAITKDEKGRPRVVKITTPQEFEDYAGILKLVKGKMKFLDEERKISVGPLNAEVKRINGWFAPALKAGEEIVKVVERMMGAYLVAKKAEEQRLMAEAAAKAKAALAAGASAQTKTIMKEVASISQQASSAMPAKVAGVSDRAVWKFTVVDATKLDRRFLMPDMAAIKAHVDEHGDKDIPDGVTVEADFKFTVRS